VNAKIFASLLGLKSNSVNTNFRSHWFAIVGSVLPIEFESLPPITDEVNWKKRKNASFTAQSTLADAETNVINDVWELLCARIAGGRTIVFVQPPSTQSPIQSNEPLAATVVNQAEEESDLDVQSHQSLVPAPPIQANEQFTSSVQD
jgi:hypothetical protein